MERLKIEEIANNYGMHLKDFAQRKLLADQINFALDFGMEYYQVGFQLLLIKRLVSIGISVHNKIFRSQWFFWNPMFGTGIPTYGSYDMYLPKG